VPAQSGFASLMTGSEYGVAHLPTRPEEKAETAVSVSTECIEFRGKRKCRRAIVRIAGDSKAQEAQLPLLQFAFRPLKRFNHHEHRWARHCADYLCSNLSAEFEAGKGRRRISTSSRVRPALPGIANVDSRQELKAQPPASPARSAPPSLLQCILMRFLYLRIQHPLENLCGS